MAKSKPPLAIRRPPKKSEPDPEAVEHFISSEHPVFPASSASSTEATVEGRGIVQRQSGKMLRRMTVYLEPELAKRFAIYCAAQGAGISETLAEAVSMFLAAKQGS